MTYYTCYATPEEKRADREKIEALLPKKETVRPAGTFSAATCAEGGGEKKKIKFFIYEEVEYA